MALSEENIKRCGKSNQKCTVAWALGTYRVRKCVCSVTENQNVLRINTMYFKLLCYISSVKYIQIKNQKVIGIVHSVQQAEL